MHMYMYIYIYIYICNYNAAVSAERGAGEESGRREHGAELLVRLYIYTCIYIYIERER